jgi:integrase
MSNKPESADRQSSVAHVDTSAVERRRLPGAQPPAPTDWHYVPRQPHGVNRPKVAKPTCSICGCPTAILGAKLRRWHRARTKGDPVDWRWVLNARRGSLHGATSAGLRIPQNAEPNERVRDRLRQAAILIGPMELSIAAAARKLAIDAEFLRKTIKKYHGRFVAELARARKRSPTRVHIVPERPKRQGPPGEVLDKIKKAVAAIAAGVPQREVVADLGIHPGTIGAWQEHYAAAWRSELDRAMEVSAGVVRELAGREGKFDPAAFLRQARACERWALAKGLAVFPKPADITLSGFFESYYRPVRLADASKDTMKVYQAAVRSWVAITGDPPLRNVTPQTLVFYRDRLSETAGRSPGSRRSPTSLRNHLSHVLFILNKAGPAGPRNRDAAGLIDQVPWIRLPRLEWPTPRTVPIEHLDAVHRAAVYMTVPQLPGVSPATWWRALVVIAFNTGMRRRTLFGMEWQHVDWRRGRINLPAKLLKSRRPQVYPLNRPAIDWLLAIRPEADSGLIFPWPLSCAKFDKYFHQLQQAAGIAAENHFGLQHLRKSFGTSMFEISPSAAMSAMGHTRLDVTMKHYLAADGLVTRAVEALPQPAAFVEAIGPREAATVAAGGPA